MEGWKNLYDAGVGPVHFWGVRILREVSKLFCYFNLYIDFRVAWCIEVQSQFFEHLVAPKESYDSLVVGLSLEF